MNKLWTIPAASVPKCRDWIYMYYWLKNANYQFDGILPRPNGDLIVNAKGGAPDPAGLVSSFQDVNHYEVTCNGTPGGAQHDFCWGPTFKCYTAEIGASLQVTVKKIKGSDDSVIPDNDTLDIHWHGTKMGAPTTLTLVNGVGSFVVSPLKRSRVFIEGVPTGSSDLENKLAALRRGGLTLLVGAGEI